MWAPQNPAEFGPIYQRIAAALARDISSGSLSLGERLPTLQELAITLGVTPGTINRAYELAHRRGLVDGEVGRGTYVRTPPARKAALAVQATEPDLGAPFDLSIVEPNAQLQEPYLRAALLELAQSARLPDMLDYTPDGALLTHRQAGVQWLAQAGLVAQPEQVVLTCGGQHGLWLAVAALTRPGEFVLCESLCYPGVASVVQSLGRRLHGVALDQNGMQPQALRELCMRERPALVICIANVQNPTGAVMPMKRRQEIAALAREFDFKLVDDALYSFLAPKKLPPLASFAPERSLYISSLSKSVASTVRLGYVHGPAQWLARLSAAVRTSVWMVSPLAAELATSLIVSGRASEMAAAQRAQATARQTIARGLFQGFELTAQPAGFHLWLRLPEVWPSGEQFTTFARGHQLHVAGGDGFAMNRDGEGHQHVRIALMSGSTEQLRFALTKLAGLMTTPEPVWL